MFIIETYIKKYLTKRKLNLMKKFTLLILIPCFLLCGCDNNALSKSVRLSGKTFYRIWDDRGFGQSNVIRSKTTFIHFYDNNTYSYWSYSEGHGYHVNLHYYKVVENLLFIADNSMYQQFNGMNGFDDITSEILDDYHKLYPFENISSYDFYCEVSNNMLLFDPIVFATETAAKELGVVFYD